MHGRRACRFAQYNKDDPASFRLMPEMTLFPGFVFHMRRSQFVQVFGNSPDETAYARLLLSKESVNSAVLMLQPQLLSYSIAGEGDIAVNPVIVDVSSIVPGAILFMDAYFTIVVFHGADIARWRQDGCAARLPLPPPACPFLPVVRATVVCGWAWHASAAWCETRRGVV